MTRVGVFIDWQNAYHCAREAFGWEQWDHQYGTFSPYALAKVLASRNKRGASGVVSRVEIHRGLPGATRDPKGHAAVRRQSAAWMKENQEVVIPRLRPLRYPRNWPDEPEGEKGIDVQLALGIIEAVLRDHCEVAILFSNDTDLLPVVETVARIAGTSRIETASWHGHDASPRLRTRLRVVHHSLDEAIFRSVEDLADYSSGHGSP